MTHQMILTNEHMPHFIKYATRARQTGYPIVRRDRHADAKGAVIFALGPSLMRKRRDTRDALKYARRKGWITIGIKESLSWLKSRGVTADYSVNIDPGEMDAERTPHIPGVTYLLASTCNPRLYDSLIRKRARIEIFHSASGFTANHPSGKVLSEWEFYAALWPGVDTDGIGGGATVANRAVSLCRYFGIPKVVIIGADFGMRESENHYTSIVKAKPVNVEDMSDHGKVDGRPWRTKGDLLVSACHMAEQVLDGYVTVLGDSLAASLAKRGKVFIDTVILPPDKAREVIDARREKPVLKNLVAGPIIRPNIATPAQGEKQCP